MLTNLRNEFLEIYKSGTKEEQCGALMFWTDNESLIHSALLNIHNDIIYEDVPSLEDIEESIKILEKMNHPDGLYIAEFSDGSLHDELLNHLEPLQAFLTCVYGINRYTNGTNEINAIHKHSDYYTAETIDGTLRRIINKPDKGYQALIDYCYSGYVVDEDKMLPFIHPDYDYYTELDELRALIDRTKPHDYIPTTPSDYTATKILNRSFGLDNN